MKIAVNTRLLLRGQLDGIGWFTYEHFSRICRAHPEHEFHFFFDRAYDPAFIFSENVHAHVIPPQARHPLLFRIWYDFMLPAKLKKIGADIFVSPDMICSLRTNLPQVVVLHDLNFEHYPEDLPSHISRYLRKFSPRFAHKAKTVVTVSEYSRQDIIKQYKLPEEKVKVVYNAASSAYRPSSDAEKEAARRKFAEGKPYFVFVSSIHPRKNLQRLLQAFDLFRQKTNSDVKLVIVGKRFWKNEVLDAEFKSMKHGQDVLFTGRLEQEELRSLLGGALASVYPSYYEGFGLPVVEAFQTGVPVITSNVTALPEIAGDAALLTDPFSVESISHALFLIWSDEGLRSDLIRKGLDRARHFSWDTSAEQFWNIITTTAGCHD